MTEDNSNFDSNVIEINPLTRPSTVSTVATRVVEPGKEDYVPPVPPIPRDYSTVALDKSYYSSHEGEGAIPDDAQVRALILLEVTERQPAKISIFRTALSGLHL